MGVVYNVNNMPREYKMIRLDPEVYYELNQFRVKDETFSNAIWRLLQSHKQIRKMLKSLAGEKVENA
jgi:predicted CopG family antitoxin